MFWTILLAILAVVFLRGLIVNLATEQLGAAFMALCLFVACVVLAI